MKKLMALLLSLVMILGISSALADEIGFTTGGTGGMYYAYGTVLAQYISNNTDVKINVAAGNGSMDNVDKLDMNVYQLGFVQNDVAYYALNGIRLFEGEPVDSFTALASLYTEAVQLVTIDPEIKSVADLKGKRVSIGTNGSGVYFNALDFLAAYDLTEADISAQYLNFNDSSDSLKDGKIDAAFVVAGIPTASITELATARPVYFIGLDDEHIDKLVEISGAYSRFIIPADAYGTDSDVVTVGMKATIIANEKVTDEQAYTIVSTIFENKDAIVQVHAMGEKLDLEFASECGLPYHPGAAKYFAEKGITVETK